MSFVPIEFRALPPGREKNPAIKGATTAITRAKVPQMGTHESFYETHKGTVRLKVVLVDQMETPTRVYLEADQYELQQLIGRGWKEMK